MEFLFVAVGGILGLAAFVCCILVIVKMFQNQMTGIGVASIVGLFVCGVGYILTLIYGWQNKVAWGLQKIMPIYTICLAAGIVFFGIGYAILIPKMLKSFQEQSQQASDEYGSIDMDPSGFEPVPE